MLFPGWKYEPRIRSRLAALREIDLDPLDLPALIRVVPHVLAESAEAFRDIKNGLEVDSVLDKPFKPDELSARVRKVLDGHPDK